MIALLNISSLILGLIAWIIPIINILKRRENNNNNWLYLSVISMSACATSIYLQILVNNYLVIIEDFSAIMDTIGTLAWVSTVLLIITVVLNIITLLIYKNRKR